MTTTMMSRAMAENPGIAPELVDQWLPYLIVLLIGLVCGATLENWARRSYHARKGEIDKDRESAS